ncbi:MAG: hypothetical protein IPO90_00370 [Flavobacteriales bacterium]|nr:hypothetical protein [Flavobacteriales bacterium]
MGADIEQLIDRLDRVIERVTSLPFFQWLVASPFRISIALTVFAFFWNFPSYDLVFVRGEVSQNWAGFLEQVNAPFTDHTLQYPDASHSAKLGFRFVPALICRALNIHTVAGAVVFQTVTTFALHALLFTFLGRYFSTRPRGSLACLPFCLIAGGHPYNLDLWGFFDSLALTFLLAAMVTRRKALVILFLLLAWFTDERALIASPVLLFLEWAPRSASRRAIHTPYHMVWPRYWPYLLAGTLYVVIRLLLGVSLGLRTAPVALTYFTSQLPLTFRVLFHGCEGFIIPLCICCWLWWRSRRIALLVLFLICLSLVLATSVAVIDMERSMAYALPHLLVLVVLLRAEITERMVGVLLLAVAFINLFYSDALPFLVQLVRMIFITRTLVAF